MEDSVVISIISVQTWDQEAKHSELFMSRSEDMESSARRGQMDQSKGASDQDMSTGLVTRT